jgi:hypothetical protein
MLAMMKGNLKPMEMEALRIRQNIERRVEQRYACSKDIFFATRSQLYEGQLDNYSRNGLFIKTKEDLPTGALITVVDPNPDGNDKKRQGQILWKNEEGFGVALFQCHNYR